jgi:hypothetical protein
MPGRACPPRMRRSGCAPVDQFFGYFYDRKNNPDSSEFEGDDEPAQTIRT